MPAIGSTRPDSPPVTATGEPRGRKVRKTDERAARLLVAWRKVFLRGEQSTAQIASAIQGTGKRHRELRAAVIACVGKGKGPKGSVGIAAKLGVFLRQRRVESERYRLASRYDGKEKAWRYWIEIRGEEEPEPLRVAETPLEALWRTGALSVAGPPIMREPVLREPGRPAAIAPPLPLASNAPAIDIVPTGAEQAIEQGPLVFYAYPDGRVRGAKHFATLAKAAGDVPAGLRSVAQAPRAAVRMQPSASVFDASGPAPFDDGPSDCLPQMKWRPPGAGR